MNKPLFIALAAFATIASSGAQAAGEADYNEQAPQAVSSLSRADVRAEAVLKARNHNPEPLGSRIAPTRSSDTPRATVRTEGADALRAGTVSADGTNYAV